MNNMDIAKIGKIASIVIIAIVAILGLFLPLDIIVQPAEMGAQSIAVTKFRAVDVDDNLSVGGALTVDGAITGAGAVTSAVLTATDDLSVGDDAGITGDLTTLNLRVTGQANIADLMTIVPKTAVAVGSGATITPTGTFQPITSTEVVTCDTTTCVADGANKGDLLILQNANVSDTITIDGTGGNVECKADVVLGAQDTLWLIWNGANWICLATHDNS